MAVEASDSNKGSRLHLLDLIDCSSVSGRRRSLLATLNPSVVREIRHGSMPRLDTLGAHCHTLGVQIQVVPLDEAGSHPRTPPLSRGSPNGPGSFGKTSAKTSQRFSAVLR